MTIKNTADKYIKKTVKRVVSKLFAFVAKRKGNARLQQIIDEKQRIAHRKDRIAMQKELARRLKDVPGVKVDIEQEPGHPPERSSNRGRGEPPTGRPVAGGDVSGAEWHQLISSCVDKIRYGYQDHKLQVVYKNFDMKIGVYEYYSVEPTVFESFLKTHSPGQFSWYVLRQYGYRYRKLSGVSIGVSAPAITGNEGEPFAISEEIQTIQRQAGRRPKEGGLWNHGEPVARGVGRPPYNELGNYFRNS